MNADKNSESLIVAGMSSALPSSVTFTMGIFYPLPPLNTGSLDLGDTALYLLGTWILST